MIKKHPGLIGLPRPSFMSRTHICEYRDKLYNAVIDEQYINEILNNTYENLYLEKIKSEQ